MNPNSISHRLFVAALGQSSAASAKRSSVRASAKNLTKTIPAKSAARAARKLSDWSWSGWQHTTT